jgi:hypothetical protein
VDKKYYAFNCQICNKSSKRRLYSNSQIILLCKSCNRKKITKEKYGVENTSQLKIVKDKIKQTKLKKYGNENYNNSDKTKQTNLKKYGMTSLLKSNKIKNKAMIKKYGVRHSSYRKETINKRKKTFSLKIYNKIKTFNINPLFSLQEWINKQNKYEKFNWECKNCNAIFKDYYANGIEPRCPTCYPKLNNFSKTEKEIVAFIKSLNINVIENDRTILNGLEIDIYLPDYNLAIEYNGLYWHDKDHKDKWYHQRKVELCFRKGIRLLHLWESEEHKEKILYYLSNNEFIKVEKPRLVNKNNYLIWI